MKGKYQFTNSVEIDAPKAVVWPFIDNSKEMENWSDFVPSVEIQLKESQVKESLNSVRKVDVIFGKKSGYFMERRIVHEEGSKIGYHIYEDTVGFKKFLKQASFIIEISSITDKKTLLRWSFYQQVNGVLGWLVHPMFKKTQAKGNNENLQKLKTLVEKSFQQNLR
ncbi:SRPBCC family protein [Flavivirga aquimarina]|uniref:SRPBCC family protein n=1 Tax=Flavivirga aquimarina TaxID=2027862 RepID=A0ABT8WAZ1_9FLAO|nr:SRPBCC family protein [Flavivirga aquimarina]MDO5970275.1 SRPBCC family protein [Flavivirga aquimarina]